MRRMRNVDARVKEEFSHLFLGEINTWRTNTDANRGKLGTRYFPSSEFSALEFSFILEVVPTRSLCEIETFI